MAGGDWEEVKKLAADFQRAQLSIGVQRLSERNCIEIINKLTQIKQLEVFYTTDGKEYITPQHLVKEIKDELFVHNGRINLVELAKLLSLDFSIVSSKASDIEKTNSSISIVNGQLIDNSYLHNICDEINEKLKIKGKVTIADLTSQYDLPSDFLVSVVEKQLGKLINAEQDTHDRHIFFTSDYKKKNINLVRGAFLALTKPIQVSTVLGMCNIEEHLFQSAVSYLNESKQLAGVVTGKDICNSVYTPSIHTKSQFDWVNNFYNQNGYLDFSTLSRLGITNPVKFIEKKFSNTKLFVLDSCAVGSLIFEQVEAVIEDTISSASFVNILPILPTMVDENDAELILNKILKKKSNQNLHIFNSSVVITDQYLRNLLKIFDKKLEEKAQKYVLSGEYFKFISSQDKGSHKTFIDEEKAETKVDKREERRRKAAEGKIGGGTQGRETKTKSAKKKYGKFSQNDDDLYEETKKKSDKETGSVKIEIIQLKEIIEILAEEEMLKEEDSEQLIEEIANYLMPKLHKMALEICKSIYESTISATNQDRKKKHNELQEKLNDLVLKVKLFEKGYKQFTAKDIQQQLAKYLLKSICTDVVNAVFGYVVTDDGKFESKEKTNESRLKALNSVPNDLKETLIKLNKSLASSNVDEFLDIIEESVGPGFCDILLKKVDRKRERSQLLEQRQNLIDQLNITEDPALVLHLSSLIIFQEMTQTMLHASGRYVSTILTFLQQSLPQDIYYSLQKYHDSVLKVLTAGDAIEKLDAEKFLQEEMHSIKEITLSFRKNSEKVLD